MSLAVLGGANVESMWLGSFCLSCCASAWFCKQNQTSRNVCSVCLSQRVGVSEDFFLFLISFLFCTSQLCKVWGPSGRAVEPCHCPERTEGAAEGNEPEHPGQRMPPLSGRNPTFNGQYKNCMLWQLKIQNRNLNEEGNVLSVRPDKYRRKLG